MSHIRISLIAIFCLFLSGCGVLTGLKHAQSSITGLNRVVKLYDASGKVIREWHGKFTIEDNGGSISFVDNYKTIKLAGTYTAEEI